MMSERREDLDLLLGETVIAHVAAIVEGRPIAMPTAFAVIDDRIVIHGSTGSRWMRALTGQDASVSVTRATGLMVARSMFEMSILYRSAVLFGRFAPVGPEAHERMLEAFTERVLPGRPAELRPSTRKELAATMLLEMPIEEWSLRVSEGMPEDDEADLSGDAWSGIITLDRVEASAHPVPDLREGIGVPSSVTAFVKDPRGLV